MPPTADETPGILGFTMDTIEGTPQQLGEYRGDVIMVVNVASRCGLTPQYEALQELYDRYRGEGFTILGFPANNFGGQEPGTNKQIAEFCSDTYGVSFPMFAKISVKGDDAHPLYRSLAELPSPLGGEPRWNFTKFLIDREGRVVERFEPQTAPDARQVTAQIEALLALDS